jgi:hypothetical protein
MRFLQVREMWTVDQVRNTNSPLCLFSHILLLLLDYSQLFCLNRLGTDIIKRVHSNMMAVFLPFLGAGEVSQESCLLCVYENRCEKRLFWSHLYI